MKVSHKNAQKAQEDEREVMNQNPVQLSCAFCAFSWLILRWLSKIGNNLPLSVVSTQAARCFAQLLRIAVGQVNPIDDADDGGFNGHVLIADRRPRGFAKRAHHRLSRTRAET